MPGPEVAQHRGVPVAGILIGVLVLAVAVYLLHSFLSPSAGEGVSNAKINSSTEIQFDYKRDSPCKQMTFDFKFYDGFGFQVDEFSNSTRWTDVIAGHTYHFVVDADPSQPINSRATHFEADASCSG